MKNEKEKKHKSEENVDGDSCEMFSIIDGKKTDRHIFAEEISDEDDERFFRLRRERRELREQQKQQQQKDEQKKSEQDDK